MDGVAIGERAVFDASETCVALSLAAADHAVNLQHTSATSA